MKTLLLPIGLVRALRNLFVVLLFLSFVFSTTTAQDYIRVEGGNLESSFLKYKQGPTSGKVNPQLLYVKDQFETGLSLEGDTTMSVSEGKILVEVVAATPQDAQTLLGQLEAMGMTDGVVYKRVINGMLPFHKIIPAGDLELLKMLDYVPKPGHDIGATTSQGDVAMGTDKAREGGLDGQGIKVGILSDGFNALGGAPAGIASGDLPGPGNPNGFNEPVQVLQDLAPGSGIDEGRAMAEIVHDVAPGASMAFATAFGGRANFANNIRRLRYEAACDVIVDDIFYLNAAAYQDGIVGQAVEEVTADGANYFSSAGNASSNSYENDFNLSGTIISFFDGTFELELHDFGGGDVFQDFVLGPGGSFSMSLWWDEPFFSVSGPPGAQSDLDILVLDENNNIVSGSARVNVNGDANEFFGFTNTTGATQNYKLIIGRFVPVPSAPSTIKYTIHRFSSLGIEYADQINKPTTFGHKNTQAVMAVGAARYTNTPNFGQSPPIVEGFSSLGGVPILFDGNGNRLGTPEIRQKPDFVGPNGGNTTFFGFDFEGDGFPNFFGTSASAPHLAGLAALVKQQYLPGNTANINTDIIRDLFQRSSIDMGEPGFDFRTGTGFVDGFAAVNTVRALKERVTVPTMTEWGVFLFGFVIVLLALVSLVNLQGSLQPAGGLWCEQHKGLALGRNFMLPIDKSAYWNIFKKVILFLPLAFIIIYLGWGEFTAADFVFVPLTAIFTSYMIYLIKIFR